MRDWNYRHHQKCRGGKCRTGNIGTMLQGVENAGRIIGTNLQGWKMRDQAVMESQTPTCYGTHNMIYLIFFPKSWRVGNTRKERPWRWNRCGSKSPDAACWVGCRLQTAVMFHYRLASSSMHCILFVPYLIIYFSLHTMNRSTSGASLIGLGLKKNIGWSWKKSCLRWAGITLCSYVHHVFIWKKQGYATRGVPYVSCSR